MLWHYQSYARMKDGDRWLSRRMVALLYDPETKRVLFDSRQAALFADLGERPPAQVQALVRPPFDQFFLELDEPIELGYSRSGAEPDFGDVEAPAPLVDQPVHSTNNICRAILVTSDDEMVQVMMFFTSADWSASEGTGYYDARIFLRDLDTGLPLGKAGTFRSEGLGDPTFLDEDIPDESFVRLDDDRDWSPCEWASNLLLYAGLTNLLLTYMVAKGVQVVPEPLSRQQRRKLERKGLPNPWHVVRVEPRSRTVVQAAPAKGSVTATATM